MQSVRILKIDGKVFFNLQRICTSKVLFFRSILNRTNNFNNIIWRDCVTNNNFKQIVECPILDKIIVNERHRYKVQGIFGGLLSQESEQQTRRWTSRIEGCVIKIPSAMVSDVCDLYIQCLQHIDSTFNIYDDEIVLSYMYNIHPELFHIINR